MNKETSKDMLHAMADGQVNSIDVPELLEEIDANPELQKELCEIRRIKDMVKHAYPLEYPTDRPAANDHWQSIGKVAAVLFLAVASFSLGWFNSTIHKGSPVAASTVKAESDKSIIFIGYSDKQKFKQTLAKAEELLRRKDNPQAEVYVVASAGGIDLMRASVSPYQYEIKKMLAQYKSVRFVACNTTMDRYKKEGKPVNLIKHVEVAPSAVEFVASRLNKGWNYISI